MNFQALKGMIDSLVQTYQCPNCGSSVTDNSVEIVGTAGTNINIDVECPTCEKHSMIKAEMLSFDIGKLNISKENLGNLKDNISKLKTVNSAKKVNYLIKDEEIVDLNKKLKQVKDVSELFN